MSLPVYGRVIDEDDAAANRQLHCRKYNECLSFAVRNDWPGFVCTSCMNYDRMDRFEYFRDIDAMTDMLQRMSQVTFSAEEKELMCGSEIDELDE